MKYHVVHYFRICSQFKENYSEYFEDFPNLKLLRNYEVNHQEVLRIKRSTQLITSPRNEVRLTLKFVRSFSFIWRSLN